MNGWDHARGGLLVGLAFGLAAGALVLARPSPTNVVVLRVLGSPFLFVVRLVTTVCDLLHSPPSVRACL